MALAYIDTNIFLGFYQRSDDRLAVFKEILARAKGILLTQQTVEEFRRNRVACLTHLAHTIKKGPHGEVHTTPVVRALPGFKKWVQARDSAKAAASEIADELTSWARDEQRDLVSVDFEQLVGTAPVIRTTPELMGRAKQRKLLGQPPTSPDKHTIGDELNWECLLSWNQSDIVIITRDKTYLDNQALLMREFAERSDHQLMLITDSLSDGLAAIGKASTTIEEAEKNVPGPGACPSCGGELEEDGFEGGDGDSAWWQTCTKCHEVFGL